MSFEPTIAEKMIDQLAETSLPGSLLTLVLSELLARLEALEGMHQELSDKVWYPEGDDQ